MGNDPMREALEYITQRANQYGSDDNSGALDILHEIDRVARSVLAAPTTEPVAWSASTHDEIIKRLMAGVGMPNSTSLYVAFKQFANELHALAHAAPVAEATEGVREIERAKDYVDRAIASYAGDPADNQFQKGFLAALEVVRSEAFSRPGRQGGAQ